jgi:hypothetical protein
VRAIAYDCKAISKSLDQRYKKLVDSMPDIKNSNTHRPDEEAVDYKTDDAAKKD